MLLFNSIYCYYIILINIIINITSITSNIHIFQNFNVTFQLEKFQSKALQPKIIDLSILAENLLFLLFYYFFLIIYKVSNIKNYGMY